MRCVAICDITVITTCDNIFCHAKKNHVEIYRDIFVSTDVRIYDVMRMHEQIVCIFEDWIAVYWLYSNKQVLIQLKQTK